MYGSYHICSFIHLNAPSYYRSLKIFTIEERFNFNSGLMLRQQSLGLFDFSSQFFKMINLIRNFEKNFTSNEESFYFFVPSENFLLRIASVLFFPFDSQF